jgi:hypothetical protein
MLISFRSALTLPSFAFAPLLYPSVYSASPQVSKLNPQAISYHWLAFSIPLLITLLHHGHSECKSILSFAFQTIHYAFS